MATAKKTGVKRVARLLASKGVAEAVKNPARAVKRVVKQKVERVYDVHKSVDGASWKRVARFWVESDATTYARALQRHAPNAHYRVESH